METCALNTVTSLYIMEKLIFLLLVVVSAVILAAAVSVGLIWATKLIYPICQAPAAINVRKSISNSREIPANVMPVQATSTDNGELVI